MPPVTRWTGHGWERGPDGARVRVPHALTVTPPHALWQSVAAMADMSARYRAWGVPLLGKRQARQWLKELGARRRQGAV